MQRIAIIGFGFSGTMLLANLVRAVEAPLEIYIIDPALTARGMAYSTPYSEHLLNVPSLYDAAVLLGRTVREVIERDADTNDRRNSVDFGANFLIGGQIKGEGPRLFHVYPQGNFIEATEDTPYFQIGESKYGKPIIDRVVSYETTPLDEAAKCTLVSFDSTIRSNLSVGLPIDMLMLRANQFEMAMKPPHRIGRDDPYFLALRTGWSAGLRKVFDDLPNEPWFDA